MKAQKQVLDEQREEKERKENEEAAEKEKQRQESAAASVEYPSGAAPSKKRHLGFAERAQQKMLENEEKEGKQQDSMLILESSEQVLENIWPEAANI